MSRLLDPKRDGKFPFAYHDAKTHDGSAEAFAQRQKERLAQVRAAAASKVQPIKRKGEK